MQLQQQCFLVYCACLKITSKITLSQRFTHATTSLQRKQNLTADNRTIILIMWSRLLCHMTFQQAIWGSHL